MAITFGGVILLDISERMTSGLQVTDRIRISRLQEAMFLPISNAIQLCKAKAGLQQTEPLLPNMMRRINIGAAIGGCRRGRSLEISSASVIGIGQQ